MFFESSPFYFKLLGTSVCYFCERKNMVFLFPLSPRLQNSKFTANYSPVNSGLTL